MSEIKQGDVLIFKAAGTVEDIIESVSEYKLYSSAIVYGENQLIEKNILGEVKTIPFREDSSGETAQILRINPTFFHLEKLMEILEQYLNTDSYSQLPYVVQLAGLLVYKLKLKVPEYDSLRLFSEEIIITANILLSTMIYGRNHKNNTIKCENFIHQCLCDYGLEYQARFAGEQLCDGGTPHAIEFNNLVEKLVDETGTAMKPYELFTTSFDLLHDTNLLYVGTAQIYRQQEDISLIKSKR